MYSIKSKLFTLICCSMFTASSYADVYNCTGTSESGGSVSAVYDSGANTITIGGMKFNITGYMPNSRDLRTEEFADPQPIDGQVGKKVYLALSMPSNYSITVRKMDAANNQVLFTTELNCE